MFYDVADSSTVEVLEGHVNVVEDWLEANRDDLGIDNIYSWFSEENNRVPDAGLPARGQEHQERLQGAGRRKLEEGLPTIAGVEINIGDHHGRQRGPQKLGYVRVAVHGEDPEYLEEIALDIEDRLRGIEDVKEIYGPSLIGRREVRVMIDPERARALGIDPMRIAETVTFAFRGQRLRRFHGERGEIEVIVGLPETARPGLAGIKDLQVPRGDGEFISLSAVADVVMARTSPRPEPRQPQDDQVGHAGVRRRRGQDARPSGTRWT